MFQTSEQTAELNAALSKAQAAVNSATKDKVNPMYKSDYSSFDSLLSACRPALIEQGISITQWPIGSNDDRCHLMTRVQLKDQWMQCTFSIPVSKKDAHGFGSAITYLKRFCLSAVVGIASEIDDDGNSASGVSRQGKPQARTSEPAATGREAASHDHQSAKKNAVGEAAASLVAKATPQVMANPSAAPTFDAKNPEHFGHVEQWCKSRKQLHLVKSLTAAMHGKPFNKETFIEQWRSVDPEQPDREPT